MKVLLLGFILTVTSVFAQEETHKKEIIDVCKQWGQSQALKNEPEYRRQRKEQNQRMVKLLGRFFFAKNSIIQTESLNESEMRTTISNKDVATYTIGMGEIFKNETTSFEEDLKKLNEYKKRLRSIRKQLKLILKRTSSVEKCYAQVVGSGINFREIKDLAIKIEELKRTESEYNNDKIFKISEKVSKKYARHKLAPITTDDLNTQLKIQGESVALLVLHASEDGKLYDSNWDYVPKSVFNRLSPNIKSLLIYACHPDAAAERYKLKDLAFEKNITIVLPKIHSDLEWAFGGNIPAPLLKVFTKKALKKSGPATAQKIQTDLNQECTIEIDASSLQSGTLGVFINQSYIGKLHSDLNKLYYDCRLESSKNTIVLQGMNLFESVSLNHSVSSWKAIINRQKSIYIDHSFNRNEKYVGSKAIY